MWKFHQLLASCFTRLKVTEYQWSSTFSFLYRPYSYHKQDLIHIFVIQYCWLRTVPHLNLEDKHNLLIWQSKTSHSNLNFLSASFTIDIKRLCKCSVIKTLFFLYCPPLQRRDLAYCPVSINGREKNRDHVSYSCC